MTTIKKVNGIFLSFLLGGVVGSTIALLYAPTKGKYLRNDISRKTNELLQEGKRKTFESWTDAKEKAEKIIESANIVLTSNVEKVVRNTENLKDALKSGVNAYNDERKS
jgi:gas vesicle protein